MTARGEVEVTQADRDAAADNLMLSNMPSPRIEAVAVRSGEDDHHSRVQAFARHRIAHTDTQLTNEALDLHHQRYITAQVGIGKWLSAALDDPIVCDAMKADIHEWFSAGEPVEHIVAMAHVMTTQAKRIEALESALCEVSEYIGIIIAPAPHYLTGAMTYEAKTPSCPPPRTALAAIRKRHTPTATQPAPRHKS
jgi:hypothetical protein